MRVEVVSKRLELLHEIVPMANVIAVLVNPTNPNGKTQSKAFQAAARTLGLQIETLNATTEGEINAAFTTRGPARFSLIRMRSCSAVVLNLSLWRNAMPFPRFSIGESMSTPGGW
jgi:hypothetical protein